jgi:uncharacterized protein (DUF305 family)
MNTKTLFRLALPLVLTLAAGSAALGQGAEGHGGHAAAGHGTHHAATSPSDKAFMQAHETMVRAMAVKPTGSADRDFAAMMIPHHQGAIDMAKVQLQFGRDPQMRKLAEEIIAAQEREIALLKAFLEKSR